MVYSATIAGRNRTLVSYSIRFEIGLRLELRLLRRCMTSNAFSQRMAVVLGLSLRRQVMSIKVWSKGRRQNAGHLFSWLLTNPHKIRCWLNACSMSILNDRWRGLRIQAMRLVMSMVSTKTMSCRLRLAGGYSLGDSACSFCGRCLSFIKCSRRAGCSLSRYWTESGVFLLSETRLKNCLTKNRASGVEMNRKACLLAW